MIAIDTGVLIWGIRGHVQEGREDMVSRARDLIADHKERRIPVMVPSIVLAEYLSDFDSASQEKQRIAVAQSYFVAPFDNEAAWIAGELYDKEKVRVIREGGTPKQCIHADLKIIATAIAHGATAIYTDNTKDFKNLARGRILVHEIPPVPGRQGDLPGMEQK